MAKRAPLSIVYCARCRANHPEGEHRARPAAPQAAAVPKPKPRPAAPAAAQTKAVMSKAETLAEEFAESSADKAMQLAGAPPTREGTVAVLKAKPLPALVAAGFDDVVADDNSQKRTKKPAKTKKPKGAKRVIKAGKAKRTQRKSKPALPVPAATGQKTRPSPPPKKTKAQVLALVAAADERKRALKTARQQRWRAKQK